MFPQKVAQALGLSRPVRDFNPDYLVKDSVKTCPVQGPVWFTQYLKAEITISECLAAQFSHITMSKRFAESEGAREGDRAYNKRQKPLQPPEQVVEIFSARQLQDLLVFRQDDVDQIRNGNKNHTRLTTSG